MAYWSAKETLYKISGGKGLDFKKNLYINPFKLTAVDIHRDAIYEIRFFEIIAMSISDLKFDYSQQKVNPKDFTMSFKFNFIEVEFLLNKSKVLELGEVPIIIQKI